jgi:PncC family amidohydrolase
LSIRVEARELARSLAQLNLRVVFAESCTAGLISASLARIPGISNWLCGSAVTYRSQTKVDWLGVSEADIERSGAVSKAVARSMALHVLAKTPEADVAASVTGHLGPDAPVRQDGLVFVSAARRRKRKLQSLGVWRYQLRARTRYKRQQEAAELVLRRLADVVRR